MPSRRVFLATALTALAARPARALAFAESVGPAPLPPMTVYKSASCGCCKKWVDHARAAGFTVTAHDTDDVNQVKRTMKVPDSLQSCHTAVVGDYVVEGHVPADLVKKLLAEKSKSVRGLAVPGMPQGSPGMETGVKDAYDVIAFDRAGKSSVFARR